MKKTLDDGGELMTFEIKFERLMKRSGKRVY